MTKQKPKITFLINSLGEGGAQRILVTLAEQLIREGSEVTIISLAKNNFYDIPLGVNMVYLSNSVKDSTLLIPYYSWKLKQFVKKSGVATVQSHLFRANYVNAFSKTLGSHHHAVVTNHSIVSRFLNEGVSGKINLFLIALFYKKADLIVYISKRMKLDFHQNFKILKDEVVIYNPYDINMILSSLDITVENFKFDSNKRYIVTIGRLIPLKRFQDVIKVMLQLPKDVELIMLGDGKERDSLEVLSKELQLEERVHFLGQVKNPFQYIKHSDIFVLSSSVEGFPNVLIESMLCKTAIVSSDCVSGPREILSPSTNCEKQLQEGVEMAEYGILYAVGDINGLSESIKHFLLNNKEKVTYVEKAFLRAKEFSVKNIVSEYQALFV